MIKLLRKILGLCEHHWEVKDEVSLINSWGERGRRYYMYCPHCGAVKKKDLI